MHFSHTTQASKQALFHLIRLLSVWWNGFAAFQNDANNDECLIYYMTRAPFYPSFQLDFFFASSLVHLCCRAFSFHHRTLTSQAYQRFCCCCFFLSSLTTDKIKIVKSKRIPWNIFKWERQGEVTHKMRSSRCVCVYCFIYVCSISSYITWYITLWMESWKFLQLFSLFCTTRTACNSKTEFIQQLRSRRFHP